jgi:hypothetical protein
MRDEVSVAQLKPIVDASASCFSEGVKRVALDAPSAILRSETR